MLDALRRHCQEGKQLRLVTTTYTNSTERRALDELASLGAEDRVSYDTTTTRLHAKAWLFHRRSGYSTAYIGSSNLTHSAQVTGLEWNVRVSGARNPGVVDEGCRRLREVLGEPRLRPLRPRRVPTPPSATAAVTVLLSPVEIVLRALPGTAAGADRRRARSTVTTETSWSRRPVQARQSWPPSTTRAFERAPARPASVRRPSRGDPRSEPRNLPARAT